MISAAPVPHINSSARRGQQAVPAKMPRIAADPVRWSHRKAVTERDGDLVDRRGSAAQLIQ
jgi:hypothetical protein